MVSEVTDSDFNSVLSQPVSRRGGRISCQSPDSMASGQLLVPYTQEQGEPFPSICELYDDRA